MGNSTNKKNLQIFPKKITRVAKQSVFSIKLRENLMVYLFNFLSYKDLYKIGKTCIYFNNAFVLKQNKWINSIQPIADKYCFSFTSNEKLEIAKEEKVTFELLGNFLILND